MLSEEAVLDIFDLDFDLELGDGEFGVGDFWGLDFLAFGLYFFVLLLVLTLLLILFLRLLDNSPYFLPSLLLALLPSLSS